MPTTKYSSITPARRLAGRTATRVVLFLVFLMVTFWACKKTENFTPSPDGKPLKLTASDSVFLLNQAHAYDNALTLNWTTGSNYGTGAAISYKVLIDKKGNNFSTALIKDMGTSVYSLSYTVGSLNDSLLDHWKLSPDAVAILEVKLVAIIADHSVKADTTRTITIQVTPFRPVTKTLYITGNATATGLDLQTAAALTPDPVIPGLFVYQGTLSPGNFVFITTLGSLLPGYDQGADSAHIVLRKTANDPDKPFSITTGAVYSISVNLLADTINVHPLPQSPYSQLWIVGDATPNGWNIDHPNSLFHDPSNSFIFKYNEILTAGEFKIPTMTGSWGSSYYRPLSNDPPITDTTAQLVANAGGPADANDYKWKITTTGAYKIRLDLSIPSIKIIPFTPYTQLWMVGDATPTGWNIDNPTPLTPVAGNPYLFTYTGPLTAGEFKIPVTTGNFGCDYFRPYVNHPALTDTTAPFIPAGGGPADASDYKWQITAAGNYIITFNQLYETISIQKQ